MFPLAPVVQSESELNATDTHLPSRAWTRQGLVNQLVARYARSGLTGDALEESLNRSLARIHKVIEDLNDQSHPGPEYPPVPAIDADEYVERVRRGVLAKLAD